MSEGVSRQNSRIPQVCRRISRILEVVVGMPAAVVVTACIGLLAVASLFVTGYAQSGVESDTISILSEFGSNGVVRQLVAPLAVTAVIVTVLLLLRDRIARWDTKRTVIVCLALAVVVQGIWTFAFMTPKYWFNDTIQIDAYAQALNNGDMSAFVGVDEWTGPVGGDVPSYLIRVPYQAGMVWLFAGIYKVFGNGNYHAIRILNMLANMMSIAAAIGIAREATRDDDGESDGMAVKMTAILSATFLPFLMSATFVYSNAIAFSLVMGACYASAWAWSRKGWKTDLASLALTALLLSLAIMIKETFLILALVLVLCWVVRSLHEGTPLMLVPTAIMVLACMNAVEVPIWCLERAVGVELGEGQPLFTNITIGLTWPEENNAPGWFGPAAFDCYNLTDGSMEAQSQWCREYIGERISEMAADPAYATYFFRYKIASEWLDPTYQSLWFSACSGSTGLFQEATISGTKPNILLVALMDGYQTVLYALSAVGFATVLPQMRKGKLPLALLMLVGMTLAGLLVYLLWEAQAMYILPFAFLLLPVAAIGCSKVYNAVDGLRPSEGTR